MTSLAMPLRYLIGADGPDPGMLGHVTEYAYDHDAPGAHGVSVAYCNLYDETNCGRFKPYCKPTETSGDYDEGVIDPNGPGFEANLREQFARRKKSGFKFVELDNPDGYPFAAVQRAIALATAYGFQVIAKNPGLLDENAAPYLADRAIVGAIVEKDCGDPIAMDALRRKAGKPDLPVWFVFFGDGLRPAQAFAHSARRFANMWVSYSSVGEYGAAKTL